MLGLASTRRRYGRRWIFTLSLTRSPGCTTTVSPGETPETNSNGQRVQQDCGDLAPREAEHAQASQLPAACRRGDASVVINDAENHAGRGQHGYYRPHVHDLRVHAQQAAHVFANIGDVEHPWRPAKPRLDAGLGSVERVVSDVGDQLTFSSAVRL